MMEDVAMALSGDGDANARNVLSPDSRPRRWPSSASPAAFRETAPGKGHLDAFLTPADL